MCFTPFLLIYRNYLIATVTERRPLSNYFHGFRLGSESGSIPFTGEIKMGAAISAISSLIASTTGSSGGATQLTGLQKQLQALQTQLSSLSIEPCSDTRQSEQQQVNRQIQKTQSQIAQLQPSATDKAANTQRQGDNTVPAQHKTGAVAPAQASAIAAPTISFSSLGSLIDTTA
jgi:hypothetical protein